MLKVQYTHAWKQPYKIHIILGPFLKIPSLERLRQGDSYKFQVSLGYILSSRISWVTELRLCLKKTNKKKSRDYEILSDP